MRSAVGVVAITAILGCRGRSSEAPPAPPPITADAPAAPGLASPAGFGVLQVRAHDPSGAPVPVRLTFRGTDGSVAPRFTSTDIGREERDAIVMYDRALVYRGSGELVVPAGTYDVWASHGPEWSAPHQRVTIASGATAVFAPTMVHEVDTPGWSSGDFHVHAQASFDSKVPMRDRVAQFVADDVDLIVSTDHNVVADYAPVIAELGLTGQLASLPGDEITTKDWGHFGAFPLPIDPAEVGAGAVPVGGRAPAALFADVRARAPDAIIDVHHPRLEGGAIGYFHLAGFDRIRFRAHRAGFSTDFDAIEVLNGYQDADRRTLDAVLADWFAFLDRGLRVTATGNSDSHHLNLNLGGYPRNYCATATTPLLPHELVASVKAGRCFLTSGPIVDVRIGDATLGDTATARDGHVELQVTVRAASWIAPDTVTLYVGGKVERTVPLTATTNPRLAETFRLSIARDTYVVVRVEGATAMVPVVGDDPGFRVTPMAVTNPIWIDADGDGRVSPAIR